jgi:hypothetical protein
MSLPNKRKSTPPDWLTYGAAVAPAEDARGSSRAKRRKSKSKNPAPAASTSARAISPTANANANADAKDDIKISGEGDQAIAFVAAVKTGSVVDETLLEANFQDHNANATDVDESYKLDTPYETSFTLAQLQKCFVRPTKESYAPTKASEKLDFLAACKMRDGFNCEERAKRAFASLPRKVQLRIGFLGGALQYIVYAQLTPGVGKWEIIHVAECFQGSKKITPYPSPGSLCEFAGGDIHNLYHFGVGETRFHRTDANGHALFMIERFDFRTHDKTELKKIAAANKSIKDACLARRDQKALVFGMSHMMNPRVYTVQKVGDKNYGTKPFRSLRDMRKSTGAYIKSPSRPIKTDDLPTEVGKVKIIETTRGKFKVKRVTLEEYEKHLRRTKDEMKMQA